VILNNKMYKNLFLKINNNKQIDLNNSIYFSIFFAYLFISFGIYYFVIKNSINFKQSLIEGFIFGIILYGVYNTTNYSTILQYDNNVAIMDTIWGGILCMIVTGIYVQHHQNDLSNLAIPGRDLNEMNPYEIPAAKINVKGGGHSDVHYEEPDYTPQKEDQTNEFSAVSHSQDEKQVLVSETLGSRSQNIFNEDMRQAEAMAMRNRNGYE